MRALYSQTKRAADGVIGTFDFNDWLQSIASTFASYTVGSIDGLTITPSQALAVVTVKVVGGDVGQTYRVPITCTAANGLTRQVVFEVVNAGVAPAVTAPGVVDDLNGANGQLAPSQRAVAAAVADLHERIDSAVAPDLSGIEATAQAAHDVATAAQTAASQAQTAVSGKADQSAVQALAQSVAGKADASALAAKADAAGTTQALAAKADAAAMATALAAKASAADVAGLSTSVAAKASIADVLAAMPRRRGMSSDDFCDVPMVVRNPTYITLFGLYGANITRAFARPYAPSLGAPYGPGKASYQWYDSNANANVPGPLIGLSNTDWFNVWLQDINAWAAIGSQFVITCAPQRVDNLEERHDPAWWGSAGPAQLTAWWVKVATFFKGNDKIFAFDILNEAWAKSNNGSYPDIGYQQQQVLNDWQDATVQAIQAVDPTRLCIVGVGIEGQAWGYAYMKPLQSKFVLYSAHFYKPDRITLGGGSYVRTVSGGGTVPETYPSTGPVDGSDPFYDTWGKTRLDKKRILNELETVIAFQKKNDVQMFIGEFAGSSATPVNTAPDFLQDVVDVFESYGWHWNFHAFSFLPLVFAPRDLPSSTDNVDTDQGQRPLNQVTGAVYEARAPIVPITDAMHRFNTPYKLDPPPAPNYVAMEDFELFDAANYDATKGPWTSIIENEGDTGSIDPGNTVNPISGTKDLRIVHTGSGGIKKRIVLNSASGDPDFFLSYDIRLDKAPAAGFTHLAITQNNGDSAYFSLVYKPGNGGPISGATVNTTPPPAWYLEIWNGSNGIPYNDPQRRFFKVPLVFTPGVVSRIKLHLRSDATQYPVNAVVRLWQGHYDNPDDPSDPNLKQLVDIRHMPTVGVQGNALNQVRLGMDGFDAGQVMHIDDIRYSRGSGNCDRA